MPPIPRRVDFRVRLPDGQVVWVMSQFVIQRQDGVVQGYVGSITDISQRKEAEILLQKSQEQLQEGIRQRTATLSERNEELKSQIAESERMAQELQESESALRAFFESAPMMMGIVELIDDDILFVALNAAAPDFIGGGGKPPGVARPRSWGGPPARWGPGSRIAARASGSASRSACGSAAKWMGRSGISRRRSPSWGARRRGGRATATWRTT